MLQKLTTQQYNHRQCKAHRYNTNPPKSSDFTRLLKGGREEALVPAYEGLSNHSQHSKLGMESDWQQWGSCKSEGDSDPGSSSPSLSPCATRHTLQARVQEEFYFYLSSAWWLGRFLLLRQPINRHSSLHNLHMGHGFPVLANLSLNLLNNIPGVLNQTWLWTGF